MAQSCRNPWASLADFCHCRSDFAAGSPAADLSGNPDPCGAGGRMSRPMACRPRSPRCGRRTGTRPTRRSGSRCSTTRRRWATPAAFINSASNIGYAFNWFYVNSHPRGVLQLRASTRCAPAAPTRTSRCRPTRRTSGSAGTRPPTPRPTRRSRAHPQSVNQDYYRQLEQQAGRRLQRGRRQLQLRAGAAGATCSTSGVTGGAWPVGAKLDRAGRREGDGERRQHRPARQGGPRPAAPGDQRRSRSPTRPRRPASPSCRPGYASGAHRRRDVTGQPRVRVRRRRSRRSTRGGRCSCPASSSPASAPTCTQSLVNAMQVNESPSGGQQDDRPAAPARSNESQTHKGSSFQYGWWGYVSKDLRVRARPAGDRPLRADVLRRRLAGRLPVDAADHACRRRAAEPAAQDLSGRRDVRGRRPVVRRHDHPVAARRHRRTRRSPGRTARPTSRSCSSRRTAATPSPTWRTGSRRRRRAPSC